MTKVYVFNHQNPKDSFFSNPHDISIYFLWRRLSNHSILICNKHGKPLDIISGDDLPCDINKIESLLNGI